MGVPFVDLKANLAPIREEVEAGWAKVLDNTAFILGPQVADFEEEFARFMGTKFAVGVNDGTGALHLGMRACGIGPGDEVIVPANTYIATAIGVTLTGAKPVLVDCDPKTYLIDPSKVEAAITSKTKAILPVHLYGRVCDMPALEGIASKHNLMIVEDAAQSHGASLGGRQSGSFGRVGCFSFYPGKNLGAYGDGGAATTSDPEVRDRLLALRNYGSTVKYHHPEFGMNSRLDTLQAVVLKAKLKHLDAYNSARYEAAMKYNQRLEGVGDLVLPQIPEKGSHAFHLYVVRTQKRDEMVQYLRDLGIGAQIHYPKPVHLHGAYEHLGHQEGDFPEAEKASREILSLPLFPELTDAQIDEVVSGVKGFF